MPLKPVPEKDTRKTLAHSVRDEASYVGRRRNPVLNQKGNGELDALNPPWGTFTKTLAHDQFGALANSAHLNILVEAINQSSSNDPGVSPFPETYTSKVAASFKVPKFDGVFRWPHVGMDGQPTAPGTAGTGRSYESPLAGHTFEINGPDADELMMPPAPAIGSTELIAEMGELYGMALLRDVPFAKWGAAAGDAAADQVLAVIAELSQLDYLTGQAGDATDQALTPRARARRLHRFVGAGKAAPATFTLTPQNLFRGSAYGAQVGPYISQFMLIGNAERPMGPPPGAAAFAAPASTDALIRAGRFGDSLPSRLLSGAAGSGGTTPAKTPKDGVIRYGVQGISHRFVPHKVGVDHMTDWASWLDVQNGANRKDLFDLYQEKPRFPLTGRDLATYVHFDALYQAYLNACLILIGAQLPLDNGLPEGKGHPTRDGFATFGGPHILSLVTEVATRALKAVRRQKYQIHLRARPEAVAGTIALSWNGPAGANLGTSASAFAAMVAKLTLKPTGAAAGLLDRIALHNKSQNDAWLAANPPQPVDLGWMTEAKNALLPMAFPEGSPLHPSYGAGHATVAGACVTILKAFFEMYQVPETITAGGKTIAINRVSVPYSVFAPALRSFRPGSGANPELVPAGSVLPAAFFANPRTMRDVVDPRGTGADEAYEADPAHDGEQLKVWGAASTLTIEGELDKLAANIAIARDIAGVHYYSDYYESIRMGERVAVGMLHEQMLTYREPVSMRFRSFDGDYITIVGTGGSVHGQSDPVDAVISVWDAGGNFISTQDWWQRASM